MKSVHTPPPCTAFFLSKAGIGEWSQRARQNNTAQASLKIHIFLDTRTFT